MNRKGVEAVLQVEGDEVVLGLGDVPEPPQRLHFHRAILALLVDGAEVDDEPPPPSFGMKKLLETHREEVTG